MIRQWVGFVRDVISLMRGNEALVIRRQTERIRMQLVELQARRLLREKELEEACLRDVRQVVDRVQCLQRDLSAAEEAAKAYVDRLAHQAQKTVEDGGLSDAAMLTERGASEGLDGMVFGDMPPPPLGVNSTLSVKPSITGSPGEGCSDSDVRVGTGLSQGGGGGGTAGVSWRGKPPELSSAAAGQSPSAPDGNLR